MKRIIFLSICIICTAFVLAACSDDEGRGSETPVFSIGEQYLQQDFEQGASYVSIPVNTNLGLSQWSVASSDETWCLVSQEQPSSTSSAVLISVRASEEPDVRTATVSVTSGVESYTIQVRQLGYGPAILLKNEKPTISADGGELNITVTSNIEYTVDLPAECTWMREVLTRALTDKVYNYTVDANPTYEERAVTLTYTYTEGTESSELREMRCEGLYSVTDLASGAATYFIQNGSDIDQYVLNPAAMSGTHSVLSDQSLADITTGFMKIAYVDSSFPTLSNVEYQGEETVAGRVAAKYTQSAYNTAGLLTAYAFVWIDSEYGFASKCRVYNMTGSVNVSWELTELTVGGVSEESIGFSTDGYTITEAQVTEPTAAES